MKRTALFDRHVASGARVVEFAGWDMPIQYPTGIVEEHLTTRRRAGLFDVSHMGRFLFKGSGALPLLQKVLTNNAAAVQPGQAQYTMIPTETGGALDDAYLYCVDRAEYLLVVNASNLEKDWDFLRGERRGAAGLVMEDRSEELAMLSLQGPESRRILLAALAEGGGASRAPWCIPEPGRNNLCSAAFGGVSVTIARTGYTGEPLGFELFIPSREAGRIWDRLVALGAAPIGLGARDTLRLEAALPLYGHELGVDQEGKEIPIYSSPLARFAVSLSPLKGDFVGRKALEKQSAAYQRIKAGQADAEATAILPRLVRPVALLDPGIARQGAEVFAPAVAGSASGVAAAAQSASSRPLGWITSGTMAPYWVFTSGAAAVPSDRSDKRAVAMALLDSTLGRRQEVEIDIRGKRCRGLLVPYHLRSEAPPYARPILWAEPRAGKPSGARTAAGAGVPAAASAERAEAYRAKAVELLRRAVENHHWRQEQCINLIPSEMTFSSPARLLSVSDPVFRYAEHKKIRALLDEEVFFYQGTGFIDEVERMLAREMKGFLGCRLVETRLVSGQMANTAVFSAMVDYINRGDRRSEPRRLRSVLNNHIIRGGHLSAQPMGALRDFVARDPAAESPAVVALPVQPDDPYRIDVSRLPELLERVRPELVILGKSMVIYREPVAEIRSLIKSLGLGTVLMYDMAHVLGLVGPHFQEPFKEGADLVTGSTHKTFFGTQRGIVAAHMRLKDPLFPLWGAVRRRTFPGSVSNHHLGTLLGLLMAAYEMNAFRDSYQTQVLANAKAMARALRESGLDVAGDPSIGHTETHQVIVEVGYGRGVEVARRLEESNVIVNYQASPREEGFTAAGSLRMGVAEMTRFGMKEKDFKEVADLIAAVVRTGKNVRDEVARLRSRFLDLGYCFSAAQLEGRLEELRKLA